MKITKRQLRKIIQEEYYSKLPKDHIDGQPWPGTPEDLADVQAGTWGHGEVVNPVDYKNVVYTSRDLAAGKAKSILKLSEQYLRKIIRKQLSRFV